MAKQIKRLKDNFKKELVGLDSVVITKAQFGFMASIKGSDLNAQIDFGENVILETTTPDGKDVYYKFRPTQNSGIAIPTKEGYYSLEEADIWLDTREENAEKHIIRINSGKFVLTHEFKRN